MTAACLSGAEAGSDVGNAVFDYVAFRLVEFGKLQGYALGDSQANEAKRSIAAQMATLVQERVEVILHRLLDFGLVERVHQYQGQFGEVAPAWRRRVIGSSRADWRSHQDDLMASVERRVDRLRVVLVGWCFGHPSSAAEALAESVRDELEIAPGWSDAFSEAIDNVNEDPLWWRSWLSEGDPGGWNIEEALSVTLASACSSAVGRSK
jgi:hypothetical protein